MRIESATLVPVAIETVAEVRSGYEALLGVGGAVITERDVISIDGPDAARFLQGQLSQDVVAMTGDSAWSFLLSPAGKVVAWLRVHRIDAEHYLIETDPGWGQAVVARLQQFLLRTKAVISEPQRRLLVQERWDPAIVRLGTDDSEGVIACTPVGPGVAGCDELALGVADSSQFENHRLVPEASMERYRIARGIVRMGAELNEDTIPGEAGAWVIDASVSFTKGCYTGQELVARIDSRGNNVPHPIRVLALEGEAAVGDEVAVDGVAVGTITSSVPVLSDSLPALALARVGRSVVPGSRVTVGLGHSPASVVEPGSVR